MLEPQKFGVLVNLLLFQAATHTREFSPKSLDIDQDDDDKISRESYRHMIRKAGPKLDSARQSAKPLEITWTK